MSENNSDINNDDIDIRTGIGLAIGIHNSSSSISSLSSSIYNPLSIKERIERLRKKIKGNENYENDENYENYTYVAPRVSKVLKDNGYNGIVKKKKNSSLSLSSSIESIKSLLTEWKSSKKGQIIIIDNISDSDSNDSLNCDDNLFTINETLSKSFSESFSEIQDLQDDWDYGFIDIEKDIHKNWVLVDVIDLMKFEKNINENINKKTRIPIKPFFE